MENARDNYLKTILDLQTSGREVSVTTLAGELKVSLPTVSGMIKRLKQDDLVQHEPYGEVYLTRKGEREAAAILRRHRLWETFLWKIMKVPYEILHQEAEYLEHHDSTFLISRMDEMLGHPKFDPHGHPIPDQNGIIEVDKDQQLYPLSQSQEGDEVQIMQINDRNPSFLRYIDKIGLSLYSKLRIIAVLDFDGSMQIESNGEIWLLSKEMSELLWVRPLHHLHQQKTGDNYA